MHEWQHELVGRKNDDIGKIQKEKEWGKTREKMTSLTIEIHAQCT